MNARRQHSEAVGMAIEGAMSADPGPGGLTDAEVQARLRADGPNVLPAGGRKSLLRIAWDALTQPMFLLLLGTAGVYAALGSWTDTLALLMSVLVVGALSIYQEQRTQRTLQALKELSSPRCSVIRDGGARRVASQELVRGDRLLINEGDRLAADARLLQAHAIEVDESQLSGESLPLAKSVDADPAAALLHAGSLVVQGDGVAVVTATGIRTALGKIGGSLAGLRMRPSRLEAELRRLVRRVAVLAVFTCLIAAALFAWRDGSWTGGLLVGLTLAMSLIPEEFAVVWSVMLALGSWRLAKAQVLTRQPQAIEALGTATVLCVDKTGTLTRNQMTLAALHDGAQGVDLAPDAAAPERFRGLLMAAMRAGMATGIEPMDRAVFRAGAAAGVSLPSDIEAAGHQGVGPGRPYVVHWWSEGKGHPLGVAVKGAAEAVLALCEGDTRQLRHLAAVAEEWSAAGLRVLAVADGRAATVGGDAAPPVDLRLSPRGLLGFIDPLRDGVPEAIEECRRAGVRVMMITGDSPLTAGAIARKAGLVDGGELHAITGAEMARMSDLDLQRSVAGAPLFARVDPTQKLRIVQALQERGEVVAMTGDGVNDAPALRAADIGVAMGRRGTDVAREAASLVLLDDNFASLVEAVRAGRRIFINLHKALGYLFAVHVPIVGVALMPVLFDGPILLLPLHVVLLELLIDPACSLVFESERAPKDAMLVPPRPATQTLFSLRAALRALLLGAGVLAGVLLVQWGCRRLGASAEALRLASLVSIVVGNLLLLSWFRGLRADHDHTNPSFHGLILGVCTVGALLLGLPPVASLFSLAVLPGWCLAIAALPAGWAAWRLLGSGSTREKPVVDVEAPAR